MKIVVTGSTGFIGKQLIKFLQEQNHHIIPVTRQDFIDEQQLLSKIEGSDVVINLAGAPLAKRWTKNYMNEIVSSRISTTRKVVQSIAKSTKKPSTFFSVSAVGIYDERGKHTESNASYADDFIGSLCQDWEREAIEAQAHSRVLIGRVGVVLDDQGGALGAVHE